MKAILKIIESIARLLVWLFIKLWLWIPAVFVFGYLFFCAASEIPPGKYPGYIVLIVGACVLAAAAVTLSIFLKARKKEGGERIRRTGAPAASELIEPKRFSYQTPERIEPKRSYNAREEIEPRRSYNAREEIESKRSYNTREELEPKLSFNKREEPEPKRAFSAREEAEPKLTDVPPYAPRIQEERTSAVSESRRILEKAEQPMVFVTRKDPDILVLEYSDRLMFYRKKRFGGEPELIATEYKK